MYKTMTAHEDMAEEDIWTCPNCGSPMRRVEDDSGVLRRVCEECGTTLEGEKQDFDEGEICPNCNQPMHGDECTYCGYDLGSDFS